MIEIHKYQQMAKVFRILGFLSLLLMVIWVAFPQLRANLLFDGNVEVARAAQIGRFGLDAGDQAILDAYGVSFGTALLRGTGIAVLLSISALVCFFQSIRYRNKIARTTEQQNN